MTEDEKKALKKIERELGKGQVIGDIPILGDVKPVKPRALGKWIVCDPQHKKESQTEGGIFIPSPGESIDYWKVSAIGPDVKTVNEGDIVVVPGIHQTGHPPTKQIWGVCPEDLVVCVLEDE